MKIHNDMKYVDFLNVDKREQGTGFRSIQMQSPSFKFTQITIGELCQLIEQADRPILSAKRIGEGIVRMHIEAFFKHGLVTQAWYEKQMIRYGAKAIDKTVTRVREIISAIKRNPDLRRELLAALAENEDASHE